MGVLSQWLAIIWKDVYIQAIKRHYLVTVIEVALIILSFFAVEKDRPILSTKHCNKSKCLRVAEPREYQYRKLENFICPQEVLYSPLQLGEKLFASAFRKGSASGRKVRVTGFNSTDAMLRMFEKVAPKPRRGPEQRVVAVTLGEHGVSKNGLSFTVSFYDEFSYLSKRLNGYALFSTLPNPVTQRESVACLQLALGAAHIEILRAEKNDTSKPYDMSTRRFTEGPYPLDDNSHRWLMVLRLGVGYLVPFCLIVARVVQETQQGMREQLRLCGLRAPVYRSGHWLASFFTGTVSFAINMAYMAFVQQSVGDVSQAFLDGTNKMVVLIAFILYTSQYVSKAMLLALFFTDTTSAVVFSAFYWHVSFLVPALLLEDIKGRTAHYILTDRYTKLATASLPCVGLHWCFRIIGSANVIGEEYTLSSTSSAVLGLDNVTMNEIWTVMLVDSLVNIFLGWYLSHVLSWYIGVPYVPWFPLLPSYWLSSAQGKLNVLPPLPPDNVHFDAEPTDKEELVFVNRVEYAKKAKHILRDINFKAYEGEILAVLGPSGSGKTTLFNIMCGNAVATGGQVIVNGFDVALQTRLSREQIGVVQQRDVLFHDLTVAEHISFFGALGGLGGTALEHRIVEVQDMFFLAEVADVRAGRLQSAQKRRLAMAMAVVCTPKVLLLDEPMHSLDSASRAKMWQVLTAMKPTTCIILSTTDVEEVEVFADRISILGCGGAHKCHGRVNFIQKRYGSGYNVHINKAPKFETRRTLNALKAVVPECRVLQDHRHRVVLSLGPRKESTSVSAALKLLESDQKGMCIESIKVNAITMEDIFTRVVFELDAAEFESKRRSNVGPKRSMSKSHLGAQTENIEYSDRDMLMPTENVGAVSQNVGDDVYESSVEIQAHIKAVYDLKPGKPSNKEILLAMIQKRRNYTWQTLGIPILCWILPAVLMFAECQSEKRLTHRLAVPFGGDRLKYELNDLHPESKAFVEADQASNVLKANYHRILGGNHTEVVDVASVMKLMMDFKDSPGAFDQYKVGAEFHAGDNDSHAGRAVAWYNGDNYHTQAASLQALSSALMQKVSGDATARMETVLRPLRIHNGTSVSSRNIANLRYADELASLLSSRVLRMVLLPATTSVVAASFVLFPIDDRVSNSKNMQLISGVHPIIYWGANYIFDMLLSLVSLVTLFFPVLLCHSDFISIAISVVAVFIGYIHSMLAIVYWFSFATDSLITGFLIVNVLAALSGTVTSMGYQLLLIAREQNSPDLISVTHPWDPWLIGLSFLPPFSYTWALTKVTQKVNEDRYCQGTVAQVYDICAYLRNSPDEGAVLLTNLRYCCATFFASDGKHVAHLSPFAFHRDGVMVELLVMLVEGFLLLVLLGLLEEGFLWSSWGRPSAPGATALPTEFRPGVSEEKKAVEKILAGHDLSKPALLVLDLRKTMGNRQVLRGLTFHVEPGEAFVVLGLRGCGKSTLLNILSGVVPATSGSALIGDTPVHNTSAWQQLIGVCPEYDGLLGRLTVRQTLKLYARVRGLKGDDSEKLLEHLIMLLNLTAVVDDSVESSGAITQRKLSVAISIIGLPPVVFMNDPATGLDLLSKRKIYRTISMLRQLVKSAVVIVTQSVADCVVVSDRMAIMHSGQFQCLGSIQDLRKRYCRGCMILVKLKPPLLLDLAIVNSVHEQVKQAFPGAVHTGRLAGALEYATELKIPWSHAVLVAQSLKEKLAEHAVDVVCSDVTIEHVLLKMAKYEDTKPVGIAVA